MSVVTALKPRRGRNVELALVVFAVVIVTVAYANVGMAVHGAVPPSLATYAFGFLAIAVAFHLVLRWRAPYADPTLLPIVTLLNGLGLVMIYRLDLAHGRSFSQGFAFHQLMWSALAVAIAAVALIVVRDHRILRRFTFTAAAVGFGLLLLPLLPVLGQQINGSRIWINLGGFSFQPGEIAKIVLAVFFAGYLVQTRDALSVAGRKVLGMTCRAPATSARSWSPGCSASASSSSRRTSAPRCCSSACSSRCSTSRPSGCPGSPSAWSCSASGSYVAYLLFGHVQERVLLWLHTFSPAGPRRPRASSPRGLMGMAAGGMLGTGLGQGRPDLTPFAESDFIVPSFGEELGLIGLFALLVLYVLLVERGLRTAHRRPRRVRQAARRRAWRSRSALQCFVVVGGVTRVIPLTGLTMPFLSSGGSSLLANWTLVALLLRISDHARRPLPDPAAPSPGERRHDRGGEAAGERTHPPPRRPSSRPCSPRCSSRRR